MKQSGFTLIELMIVVTIIGILASVSFPAYGVYTRRAEVVDGLHLSSGVQKEIDEFYKDTHRFPQNNHQAGVAPADKLIGNFVQNIQVVEGAIHITFGFKAGEGLKDKILSIRPAYVPDSPTTPLSWLCGFDEPVPGMAAKGENKTNIANELLPNRCRNNTK